MNAPFERLVGAAAPLPMPNIDTDVIIRIERLTAGGGQDVLGRWAFEALRYDAEGSERPEFVFNQPGYRGAPILLAGPNFGCGSSREGAVTAIAGMGVRCVIAESFGDIFYANCFQNGMLPIRLSHAEMERCFEAAGPDVTFDVDLDAQTVTPPDGVAIAFDIAPLKREALLLGLDDIGLSLREADRIRQWQLRDRMTRPWIWTLPPGLSALEKEPRS